MGQAKAHESHQNYTDGFGIILQWFRPTLQEPKINMTRPIITRSFNRRSYYSSTRDRNSLASLRTTRMIRISELKKLEQ